MTASKRFFIAIAKATFEWLFYCHYHGQTHRNGCNYRGDITSDIDQITITTQAGETFTGKRTRRQPELVNDFVPLATETGEWMYFAPADVKRVQFTPAKAEQPAEETTE